MENDRSDAVVCDEALPRTDEPIKHVRVERVALFGARHAHRRDGVVDGELDSFGHTDSLCKDDGLVVVDEDSVVKVPTYGAGQYDLFQVSSFAYEVFHRVTV